MTHTIVIEHGLHVKDVSGDGAVFELLYLVVDELAEVLEVEEGGQELLHLRPGCEEPAASTTRNLYPLTHNMPHLLHTFCGHSILPEAIQSVAD